MTSYTASDLSVVIPTRDRPQILARTLEALSRQTASGFETVVVVDDADAGTHLPNHLPPRVLPRVLTQHHRGPAAARNRGVDAVTRPLVLFLGDDMIPVPDLVARHLARHARQSSPHHAVLGHVEWHQEVPRNRTVRWLERSGTQFDYLNIAGDDAGWGRFYSCNVSLKRVFFLDTGGFDEDFEFDYEDLDLAYRLNEKGLALSYERGAVAHHLHPYGLEQLTRRYESRARAEQLMSSKHPWFTPFFAGLVRAAEAQHPVSPLWLVVGDAVPSRWHRLSQIAEQRIGTWFHQQLASRFLSVWEGEEDLDELRRYLGDTFDLGSLWGHRQAVDAEEREATDERTFYRTSEMYLYDLTAFAMTGTKRPYTTALRHFLRPGARVLDYGCGIGSDGLRFLADGYDVSFADFDNPSTRYLRWRLEQRGIDAPVYDVEGYVPDGFDAAYAFDVIEHVDDPFAFLAELEGRTGVVTLNLLEEDPDDTHLHKPLPITRILDHAERGGLLHYRKHHSNSHFVVYRSQGRGGALSRARRLAGRTAAVGEQVTSRARRMLTG